MPEGTSTRAQVIGAQLQHAREADGRTRKDVARQLHVSSERIASYEGGEREVSLPELEIIARYLRIDLGELVGNAPTDAAIVTAESDIEEAMRLRTRIIATELRTARIAKGESLEATAAAVNITPNDLRAYELGKRPIPYSALEQLSAHLNVNVNDGDILSAVEQRQQQQYAAFDELPPALREFILDPEALPYLEAAMSLRELSAKKLRRTGKLLTRLARLTEPEPPTEA
jgi:transcriptional regulator with XRE-family HTH domain